MAGRAKPQRRARDASVARVSKFREMCFFFFPSSVGGKRGFFVHVFYLEFFLILETMEKARGRGLRGEKGQRREKRQRRLNHD